MGAFARFSRRNAAGKARDAGHRDQPNGGQSGGPEGGTADRPADPHAGQPGDAQQPTTMPVAADAFLPPPPSYAPGDAPEGAPAYEQSGPQMPPESFGAHVGERIARHLAPPSGEPDPTPTDRLEPSEPPSAPPSDAAVTDPTTDGVLVGDPSLETPIGSSIEFGDHGGPAEVSESPADSAEHAVWADRIGQLVRPDLQAVKERVLTLASAMITTLDGRPLDTIGLTDDQVARLCAMSGSVHATAAAAVQALAAAQDAEGPDVITLHHGQQQTVVLTVPSDAAGTLLLWLTADAASLGVLLIHARSTADAISAKLGDAALGEATPQESAVEGGHESVQSPVEPAVDRPVDGDLPATAGV